MELHKSIGKHLALEIELYKWGESRCGASLVVMFNSKGHDHMGFFFSLVVSRVEFNFCLYDSRHARREV